MHKDKQQTRNPEKTECIPTMNDSQNTDESQQALDLQPPQFHLPINREARLIALLAVIIYLSIFMLLTLAFLVTQNLFLLSIILIMARELAYTFHKVIDYLLLPRNSTLPTSKTPFSSPN